MRYEEALASLIDDGIKLGAGDYIPMETLEVCKEALEKQIPKKPTHIDKNGKFDGNWIKVCPVCGMKFVERFTTEDMSYPRVYHKAKYCECGQAIDWGDTE